MSRSRPVLLACIVVLQAGLGAGCLHREPRRQPVEVDAFGLANGCFTLAAFAGAKSAGLLSPTADGARFSFAQRDPAAAAQLFLRPADLGTYLLRDAEGRYLAAGPAGTLERLPTLESDVTRNEDAYVSPAEWDVLPAGSTPGRFLLRSRVAAEYLGVNGLVADSAAAASLAFSVSTACAEFPELSRDAAGAVTKTRFADGTLFGFVDAHEHLFSNLAFGAGGVFHGAPFHRLGVEHALGSCEAFHGRDGRHDMVGYFMGGAPFEPSQAAAILLTGDTGSFNHDTAGYPTFPYWPRSWATPTHQALYYRWLERAYLAGMRLMVQHATTNEVLCELSAGLGTQRNRISCNEMVSVDRILEGTRALERYLDAQAGGPGKGWFRVVTTPAEARLVIAQGKLAVILGIETSNLFDCFVRARPGYPLCDDAAVRAKLDDYYARGVRALFPVHKFDNGFSAGDGHRGFIEIGNVANTGYYENFTNVGCPDVPAVFDHGAVTFGGMNQPRDVYDAPPPIDISQLATRPFGVFGPLLSKLTQPALPGDYCQNAGLQPRGETLLREMMRRGMIIELDHLPRRSYARAYELLHQYDYPAAGTHGSDNRADLYALGGISTTGLPRCQGPAGSDLGQDFRSRIASIAARGGYPAQGFGFDFNGFAGSPRPRFGVDASCSTPQTARMAYPFTSFGGDVVFSAPHLGQRTVDFDTEGMLHIGLLPELIEDARRMGMADADLEPLFRSAEGYLRMWERAEARGAALR